MVQRPFQRAGILSTVEPSDLCDDDQQRSTNSFVFPLETAKYTFKQTDLAKCAIEAGAASDQAEKEKRAKYPEITQGYMFEPIVVECTDVYGSSTWNLTNTIDSQMRHETSEPR